MASCDPCTQLFVILINDYCLAIGHLFCDFLVFASNFTNLSFLPPDLLIGGSIC